MFTCEQNGSGQALESAHLGRRGNPQVPRKPKRMTSPCGRELRMGAMTLKIGASRADRALAAVAARASARLIAAMPPPAAGALLFLPAGAAPGALWLPQTSIWRWQTAALLAIAMIAALLIAWLAARCIRLAGQRDEAMRLSLDREAMLAETLHRLGNNLSVISAMLNVQSRELGDLGARRAIEQAAGRVRVIAEVNRALDRLTSMDARIDDMFVGELVAKCIESAGAESRVRHETTIDPIDLPKLMLTPLALLVNECVNNALEHDFPGEAHGVITIRLEARSEEQGMRRLTITAAGLVPPPDFESSAGRSASLAFMNAFALQLDGSLRLAPDERATRAVLTF
jgi:two-component sensor histidine kinase